MLKRIRRSSIGAKPCKFLFTVDIKGVVFPYEVIKSLGQEAELSISFQRGSKIVTSLACELSQMGSGHVEIVCNEKLVLEVTMYKESDSKYMKKVGKIIVHVLTDGGWVDIGKCHVDLHVIANDLQPIQISAELEKCIVGGAYLDFVISPKLLDLADDEFTVESSSEISEMTGSETPHKSPRASLTRRLSESIGLTSSRKFRVSSSPAIPNSTNVDDNSEHKAVDHESTTYNHVESTTADCNSSTSSQRSSPQLQEPPVVKKDTRGLSGVFPSQQDDMQYSNEEAVNSEVQQKLRNLQEVHEVSCAENDNLKSENDKLIEKLEKKQRKLEASYEKVGHLQSQLSRKDTEIRAVLNFQKKLELRMTDFVEKEKALTLREKELNVGVNSDNMKIDTEEVLSLRAEIEKLQKNTCVMESKYNDLQASKLECVDTIARLRSHIERLQVNGDNDKKDGKEKAIKKKPSFRTSASDMEVDELKERVKPFSVIWADFMATVAARSYRSILVSYINTGAYIVAFILIVLYYFSR